MQGRGGALAGSTPAQVDRAARYGHWKEHHVPILYDWILSRHCSYPSACVRWSSTAPEPLGEGFVARELMFTERTGPGEDPNTILLAKVRVPRERYTRANAVASRWSDHVDQPLSPNDFRITKRLVHPGEVNRMRAPKDNILITHTDAPDVYVWLLDRQPHVKLDDARKDNPNKPDVILSGHQENAEYAVATSDAQSGSEFWVASGGKDCRVLVWSISDAGIYRRNLPASLPPRQVLQGHRDTVEDVSFCPGTPASTLASVGDDARMLVWDMRSGSRPVFACERAHAGDVNCVDWCPADANSILTGGSDNWVKVWDSRKLKSPVVEFKEHSQQITELQWHRQSKTVFASSSNDEEVIVWDTSRTSGQVLTAGGKSSGNLTPQVLFRHVGHQGAVVDFQWCEDKDDPWLIASVSEDGRGSTLQVWRMFDLIHRPRNEVIDEIRTLRNSVEVQ